MTVLSTILPQHALYTYSLTYNILEKNNTRKNTNPCRLRHDRDFTSDTADALYLPV